ncbi:MAG: anthranilate synthase component I family protein, partial [Bacteroidota bacterium]|nr:anthranilate synthase component I family protein [Candidatus Kapabacteria bacterium]MDW8220718.1 anthranilate synthase component I family protein [Bacteroidota bacterium]
MKHSTRLITSYTTLLADTYTPVSMYLQLRDVFPNAILLESSDYHGNENSRSYICCKPIASFIVERGEIQCSLPCGTYSTRRIEHYTDVMQAFADFLQGFEVDEYHEPLQHIACYGVFGYMAYDAVQFCEDIVLEQHLDQERRLPLIQFHLYQYIIALNHFTNELSLIEHRPEHSCNQSTDSITIIASLIDKKTFASYPFEALGEEHSNFTDEEFLDTLLRVKQHIYRGDVFQIVLSRRFQQKFKGDDFNVYRALRSVNPSPYLFYFDYGSMRLFGSSPEAQIIINGTTAEIHPIAGTFRRSGHDATDAERALALQQDPKENAEHVMLVDLARNDLSRHCTNVHVDVYKEIQYYSHVIHLVSKISGTLNGNHDSLRIVADTFPAGTLSGAPKYMAMKLIDRYERG